MKKYFYLIIILTLLALNSYGQSLPKPKVQPTAQVSNEQLENTEKKVESLQNEIVSLHKEVEILRDYHGKILDLIYWALTGLVGSILAVISLGWYTNNRAYKKELSKYKDELKTEMTKAAVSAGQSAFAEMKREVRKLQYEILVAEAENWASQGTFANSLLVYSETIPILLEVHPELYIPKTLDAMLKTLKSKDFNIVSSGVANIVSNLDKAPKEFSIDVEAIKRLLVIEKLLLER